MTTDCDSTYVKFPGGASGKEPDYQCRLDVRDLGSIPGLERSPGVGNSNHSGILAWRIPWTEESIELHRVGHDESDLVHMQSSKTNNNNILFRNMHI